MKHFTTHSSAEIPPVAKEGFNANKNLSENYFGLVESVGGDLVKRIVRYDHKQKKWLLGGAGGKQVIEYYKEKRMKE